MTASRRPLLAAAAIGLLALIALGWWLTRAPAAARAPAATPVRTVAVSRKDISDVIRAIGTVRSQRSVIIRPQVDGELVELPVREGQQVKQGDLLARIDDRGIRAALEQTRAQLEVSEAQLKAAMLDLERFHRLRDDHVISAQQIDQQQAQVDELHATVRTNRAAIAAREVQLSYTRMYSPTDGRVGIRNFDQGSFVRAADTEGLFSVVQLDPISVEISLPQSMLPAVQALLHDAGAKPTTGARIRQRRRHVARRRRTHARRQSRDRRDRHDSRQGGLRESARQAVAGSDRRGGGAIARAARCAGGAADRDPTRRGQRRRLSRARREGRDRAGARALFRRENRRAHRRRGRRSDRRRRSIAPARRSARARCSRRSSSRTNRRSRNLPNTPQRRGEP